MFNEGALGNREPYQEDRTSKVIVIVFLAA